MSSAAYSLDSTADLRDRYLGALGLRAESPSPEGLRRLHRAHAQRFAHDTLWKIRGRIPEPTALSLLTALLDDEGGGCLHLNSSFVWLLVALGYTAALHPARVQRAFDLQVSPQAEHAVVTVDLDGETWYADVGLGNGLLEPVPLRAGPVSQSGGFCYSLEHVEDAEQDVWRFHHDRRLMAMRQVEFDSRPWRTEDFAAIYRRDSTDPASHSLRQVMVNRRREDGVSMLSGTTVVRRGDTGRSVTTVGSPEEWEHVLREEFLLGLPDWSEAERDRLWAFAQHQGRR